MNDEVAYWCGKRLTECSHEELVGAVKFLTLRLAEYQGQSEALAIGRVELLKRKAERERTSWWAGLFA